jgi:hypothetical protein
MAFDRWARITRALESRRLQGRALLNPPAQQMTISTVSIVVKDAVEKTKKPTIDQEQEITMKMQGEIITIALATTAISFVTKVQAQVVDASWYAVESLEMGTPTACHADTRNGKRQIVIKGNTLTATDSLGAKWTLVGLDKRLKADGSGQIRAKNNNHPVVLFNIDPGTGPRIIHVDLGDGCTWVLKP